STPVLEHWDPVIIDSLLSTPDRLVEQHRRILRDVKANLSAENYYQVRYSYSKGSVSGRVYSGGKGYQACTNITRTLCSSPFYDEDDMVNSFPTILHQLFKRFTLPTPFLT